MKIHNLKILSRYKNLSGLEFGFKEGNFISLLVGQNGFGKSNLVEILAIIFKSLFQLENLSKAKEWSLEENNFEYEIEYECKRHEILIKCRYNIFEVCIRNKKGGFKEINFSQFSRTRHSYLPDYIVGYYSGNSGRLKNLVREVELIEFDKLKNDQKKAGDLNPSLRPIIFTETHHSEIILMALILFSKTSEYQDRVKRLLDSYIDIDMIVGTQIEFNNPNWTLQLGGKNYSVDYLFSNLSNNVPYSFWHLKGKIDKFINFLNNYTIGDPRYLVSEGEVISESKPWIKELLLFDNLNLVKIQTDIKKEFDEPKDIFDALDACEIVDIIHSIDNSVSKKNDPTSNLNFFNLSEGEQQLITTIGLIIIFSKYDTLFLFDEPDTHLNPKWQRHYIDLIKDFIPVDQALNSHLFIATHSPLLVQAADQQSDIFLFRSDEEGKIKVDCHNFRLPNWRVDHVLLSKYFDLTSSRPKKLDDWIKKRKEIIEKGELNDRDKIDLKNYENEIGYLPTGETIMELESMAYINKMANELRDDQNK